MARVSTPDRVPDDRAKAPADRTHVDRVPAEPGRNRQGKTVHQQTFEFLDGFSHRNRPAKTAAPVATVTSNAPTSVRLKTAGSGDSQHSKGPQNPPSPKTAAGPAAPAPAGPVDSRNAPVDSRNETLRRLRTQLETAGTHQNPSSGILSTGCLEIDQWLPRGGLRGDAITEWLAEEDGGGASCLSLIAAANRLSKTDEKGPLVVVSGLASGRRAEFYPPAAKALGIEMSRLIWVRPKRHADLVWAIDQALRCPAVAVVWAEIGASLDDRDARRFQLAAETGTTPGLFVRPATVRGRPSFSDVRFHVVNETPSHDLVTAAMRSPTHHGDRFLQVTLDRCRGAQAGQQTLVQVGEQARLRSIQPPAFPTASDETTVLPLAAELAHPKSSRRTTRRHRA